MPVRSRVKGLTQGESLYLKEIYRCESEGSLPVTSVSMAVRLEVRPPSVVDMFAKLEGKELIHRKKYGPVKLSTKGVEVAEDLIWRHRVLETYFVSTFKMDRDEACEAASGIDSYVSEPVVEAMCQKLGHPATCVHGYRIPHPKEGK